MNKLYRLLSILRVHGPKCALDAGVEHLLYKNAGLLMKRYDPSEFEASTAEQDRIITVDAHDVKYFQPSVFRRFITGFSRNDHPNPVVNGHWDRLRIPFENRLIYRSFTSHFQNGVPWEETIFIQQCLDDISDGKSAFQNCRSREELFDHCQSVDELYKKIRTEGYRSAKELGNDPMTEITVNIDRSGNFMQSIDGKHRMLIAKLLDLESIPVRIYARHSEWEVIRNSETDGFDSVSRLSHPDVH